MYPRFIILLDKYPGEAHNSIIVVANMVGGTSYHHLLLKLYQFIAYMSRKLVSEKHHLPIILICYH